MINESFIDNPVIGYECYFSKENLDKSIKIFLFSADNLQNHNRTKFEFRLSNKDVLSLDRKLNLRRQSHKSSRFYRLMCFWI